MSYAPPGAPLPPGGPIPPNYRGYTSAAAAQAMQQQQHQQHQQQAQAAAYAQQQAAVAAAAGVYRPAQVPNAGVSGGASAGQAGARRGMPMMTMQMPPQPTGAPGPGPGPVPVPLQGPGPTPGLPPSAVSAASAVGGAPVMPAGAGNPVALHQAPPPPGSASGPQALPNYLMTSHRTQFSPAEYAARRARKPTSRALPSGLGGVIVGDGVEEYKKLREVERRVDGVMVRKRLDLGDAVSGRKGREGKVRVWISQEVVGDGEGGKGKKVRVKVEGRVLDDRGVPVEEEVGSDDDDEDDDDDEKEDGGEDKMDEDKAETEEDKKKEKEKEDVKPPRPRFSQFFKAISVEFEQPTSSSAQDVFADTTPVTWNKPPPQPHPQQQQQQPNPPPSPDFDSFTFTRSTSTNLRATLTLTRDDPDPETQRYTLSPPLAYILDRTEDTRSNIIVGLYEYIRALNLQESEERRSVRCDDALKRLFGGHEKIYFPMIPEVVAAHTSVVGDIKVPFSIRVDLDADAQAQAQAQGQKVEDTVYDIAVSLPVGYDPITRTLNRILSNPQYPAHLRQIASLDDQLALVVQALGHSKAKHAFLTGYADDPAGFVKRWVSSQKRDMSIILGEGENGEGILADRKVDALGAGLGDEFRRGGENGAWDTPVAREAVRYMLAKPVRGR